MYDSSTCRRWRSPNTTTWSRHSRRIEPISRSAYPFCQGERGDVGRSRMPIDRSLRMKTSPGPIPVTDQVAGSLFPTACFRDLICDPFRSGVSCDAKPQNLSSAVPHDQQSIEQAKRDRRHDEQIHRRDAIGMVMKKRLPALRRWPSSLHHILGHARLADIDAELKQLSVDPRRAPQRVGDAHLADKLAYLCR